MCFYTDVKVGWSVTPWEPNLKQQNCGPWGTWCVFRGLKNDAVLLKADTQRSLLKVITSRQIRFLGHVLRKNELEAIALTGKIEGKRARGRCFWTGRHLHAETDGQESRFWSCARDERSTSWSPTSDSDTALQQDRTGKVYYGSSQITTFIDNLEVSKNFYMRKENRL